MISPKRAAVRRVMQKQAKAKNVYEAITMEMLQIANAGAINPLKPAQPSQDYGIAGAHIEGELEYNDTKGRWVEVSYALDVYWAGKVGYVSIVVFADDEAIGDLKVDDDFQFSMRDDTKTVGKKAKDLLMGLRTKIDKSRW